MRNKRSHLLGTTLFGEAVQPKDAGGLAQKFIMPPFTILDARQGAWQERKRAWIALGMEGSKGRGDGGNLYGKDGWDVMRGSAKWFQKAKEDGVETGVSIFDPVLCELVYRWFCPPEGRILDPFAGGSTRGVVAGYLGYGYTGIELRQEQVDENLLQAGRIHLGTQPVWLPGDSTKLDELLAEDDRYDLIFTSPPYFNLEVYSGEEADGSAAINYEDFMQWYERIFAQAVHHLKGQRFVAVTVGEIRDEAGFYRNFVGDNVRLFAAMGCRYYNEAILVTAVGSLAIRAGRQFNAYRKLGKAHQNVLVFFYGGDLEKIKSSFGKVQVAAVDSEGGG